MHSLQQRKAQGETLSEDDVASLRMIQGRYQLFIEEGDRRLIEGATLFNAEPDGSFLSSNTVTYMSDSLSKASKAAYFWGSLVATAVPGYLGRKTGLVTDFLHWNYIIDHVILGALPVVTQVGSSGNHLVLLKEQLAGRADTLGMIVACLEEEEMSGFGINVIEFAKEADWRRYVNPNIEYVLLPMEDTTAKVRFEDVAEAIEAMHRCVKGRQQSVYVHCKAGKGRSWMVVMCYLVSYGGYAYADAEALVARKREQVNPSGTQQCCAREFPLRFAMWKSLKSAPPPPPAPALVTE